MTDNEIIKALECCTNEAMRDCANCPYEKVDGCQEVMLKDVKDLIVNMAIEKE